MTTKKPISRAKKTRAIIISLLVCAIIPAAIFLFPHALNKQWLIDVKYFEPNGKQRVITVYQEIGNSEDDGSFLTGYWLYLFDPSTNKQLDKIFIKRSHDDVPQYPEIHFFDEKEIWIIGRTGFASGEKPFTAILEIKDDKLVTMPLDFLNGWTIQTIFGDQISLSNQYNEIACLDRNTRKIAPDNCQPTAADSVIVPRSAFFFVKNTNTSTRNHLYYYTTSVTYPPPGIFAGYAPGDGTIPGWHLMDAVNMSNGSTDESLVKAYQAKFDSSEHLVAIQEQQLFNNPRIICSNDSICTLVATNDDGKTYTLYQFNSKGKKLWSLLCPDLKKSTSVVYLTGKYSSKETIILHPQNWVLSIDNSNGRIKWKCPK